MLHLRERRLQMHWRISKRLWNCTVKTSQEQAEDKGNHMADIIDFTKMKSNRKALQEPGTEEDTTAIKKRLENGGQTINSSYELDKLAEEVRNVVGNYTGELAVPVVSIAKNLGIRVYSADMEGGESGYIFAGGTTEELYGAGEVIVVSKKEPIGHQRFVIAHETAHYLLDYLANPKYKNKDLLFKEAYRQMPHNTQTELRADYFAAELLMPKKLFIQQYNEIMKRSKDRDVTIMCLADYFKVKISSVEKRIKEVLA